MPSNFSPAIAPNTHSVMEPRFINAKSIRLKWNSSMKNISSTAITTPFTTIGMVSLSFSYIPPNDASTPAGSLSNGMAFHTSLASTFSFPPLHISAVTEMVRTPFLLTIVPGFQSGVTDANCLNGTADTPPSTGMYSFSKSSALGLPS